MNISQIFIPLFSQLWWIILLFSAAVLFKVFKPFLKGKVGELAALGRTADNTNDENGVDIIKAEYDNHFKEKGAIFYWINDVIFMIAISYINFF